jgi:hypothetical protein
MELSLHHRIRQRAYELRDAGGRPDGQITAEREVLEQIGAPASATNRVSAPRQKRSATKNGRRKG